MWIDSALRIFLILALIYLAWVDWRTFLLPNRITYPLIILGLITNTFTPYAFCESYLAFLGVIIGYLILYMTNQIYRYFRGQDGLGMGDVKLLASLGAWLGLESLPVILSVAALLGILGGILWLRYKNLPITHAFPFGPYLAIAGIIEILWSSPFIHSLS